MRTKNLRPLALATLCLAAAFALAVGTEPCVTTYPKCGDPNVVHSCNGGGGLIEYGDPQPFGYYYCGGNSPGRCAPQPPSGTCSELMFASGTAREVTCDGTSLGFCYTQLGSGAGTGYDCSYPPAPCPDVPHPTPPNIQGPAAPCNTPGVVCKPIPIPAPGP